MGVHMKVDGVVEGRTGGRRTLLSVGATAPRNALHRQYMFSCLLITALVRF